MQMGLVKEAVYVGQNTLFEMNTSVISGFNPAVILDNKINLNDTFDDTICIKIASNRCLNNYNNDNALEPIKPVKCLVRSSNRCMAQIAKLVGRSKQKSFLQEVGLLDEYFLEIFETGSPILPDKWSDNSMITISFGQGLGVIPLSFASGIASIVNGGYKIKPTLYPVSEPDQRGKSIIREEVSEKIRYAMRQVVKNGSGKKADIPGYAVIGKTGTADQPKDGSYSEAKINTFASIFPTSNPQFVFIVMLDTPQKAKDYYYKYRHQKGGWKGTLYNTAGWTSVEVAGKIIDKIGPILATKYLEIK